MSKTTDSIKPLLTGELMLAYEDEAERLAFKYRRLILMRVVNYLVYKYVQDSDGKLNKDHSDVIAIIEWRMQYMHHFVQGF